MNTMKQKKRWGRKYKIYVRGWQDYELGLNIQINQRAYVAGYNARSRVGPPVGMVFSDILT